MDSEGSEDLGCFSSEEKAAEAANEWLDDCAKECLKAGLATRRILEQRLLFLLPALLLMGVSAKCCQTERSRLIYNLTN